MSWKGKHLIHRTQRTVLSQNFIHFYTVFEQEYTAIKIFEQEPKAAYTDCTDYVLSTWIFATHQALQTDVESINITHKIIKLVKKSFCGDRTPAVIQTADSGSNSWYTMISRIQGVLYFMKSFESLFRQLLGKLLLHILTA